MPESKSDLIKEMTILGVSKDMAVKYFDSLIECLSVDSLEAYCEWSMSWYDCKEPAIRMVVRLKANAGTMLVVYRKMQFNMAEVPPDVRQRAQAWLEKRGMDTKIL